MRKRDSERNTKIIKRSVEKRLEKVERGKDVEERERDAIEIEYIHVLMEHHQTKRKKKKPQNFSDPTLTLHMYCSPFSTIRGEDDT